MVPEKLCQFWIFWCPLLVAGTIDNRILISTWDLLQKCPQFHKKEIWRTLRKTGSYWAEEYATSQLRCSSSTEVNKFLLAYVILFQRINFWQYFVCLHERLFNCCNVWMLSWSLLSNSKRLSPRYYLPKDAIFPHRSYRDITSSQCRGCG